MILKKYYKKILLLFLSITFVSCQSSIVKTREYPTKHYDVLPLNSQNDLEKCTIDKENNSITLEKKNIKIKIVYADFSFLFNNFSYLAEQNDFGKTNIYRLVPFYVAKRAKGVPEIDNYFSQFTVFYVFIENNSNTPIYIDVKKSVLVDGLGNQYNVFDENFFRTNQFLYGYMEEAPFSGIKRTISPLTKVLGEVGELANAATSITPYAGVVKIKSSKEFYDESKRYDYKFSMDEKLFLTGGEIFPTVNYSGFLVFRKLLDNAFTFKLIIPHIIRDYSLDGKIREDLTFEFNFTKVMSQEKAYFDTTKNIIIYKR